MTETRQRINGDPTSNVFDLVAATEKRIDDLRAADGKRVDDLLQAASNLRAVDDRYGREVTELREKLALAESGRIDMATRAEARRIDALLAAAENARALATTRAELTAHALAERVDTSAKTLAAGTEALAKTLAAQVESTARALAGRIEPLEKARYEQAGGKEQRTEGRLGSQWLITLLVGVALGLLGFLVAKGGL